MGNRGNISNMRKKKRGVPGKHMLGALLTTAALLAMTAGPAGADAGDGNGATSHTLGGNTGGGAGGAGKQVCASFTNFGIDMEYTGTPTDNTFAGQPVSATDPLVFHYHDNTPGAASWTEGPAGTYAPADVSPSGCTTANAGATITLAGVNLVLRNQSGSVICSPNAGGNTSVATQSRSGATRTVVITHVNCGIAGFTDFTVTSTSDIALNNTGGLGVINGCAPSVGPSQACAQENGLLAD